MLRQSHCSFLSFRGSEATEESPWKLGVLEIPGLPVLDGLVQGARNDKVREFYL